jgi:hypothetical protein
MSDKKNYMYLHNRTENLSLFFFEVCLLKAIFYNVLCFANYVSAFLFRSQLALAHSCCRSHQFFFRSVEVEGHTISSFRFLIFVLLRI